MNLTKRESQYVSSVPMLTRQWMVEGYIWQCQGLCEQPPDGARFVTALPDFRTLIATEMPVAPALAGRVFTAWEVAIYSDADEQIPLAVLDTLGHYAQIESFSLALEGDTGHSPDEVIKPTFCRFLCGQTTGELHICPD